MVVYTVVSLSILAEPIVETRSGIAERTGTELVAVPADAVIPELAPADCAQSGRDGPPACPDLPGARLRFP